MMEHRRPSGRAGLGEVMMLTVEGTGEVIGSYKVAVRRDYTVGIIVEGRWGNNVGQIVMAMMIVNGIGRFQRAMAWARMKPWIN